MGKDLDAPGKSIHGWDDDRYDMLTEHPKKSSASCGGRKRIEVANLVCCRQALRFGNSLLGIALVLLDADQRPRQEVNDCRFWVIWPEVVLMTLLGGMGTLFGPLIGAAVIVTMKNDFAGFGA
jgi:hypothetical protein